MREIRTCGSVGEPMGNHRLYPAVTKGAKTTKNRKLQTRNDFFHPLSTIHTQPSTSRILVGNEVTSFKYRPGSFNHGWTRINTDGEGTLTPIPLIAAN